MNFTPDMMAKILSGEKKQTRRPVKSGEKISAYRYGHNGNIEPVILQVSIDIRGKVCPELVVGSRVKWELGRIYAMCPGRGKHSLAHRELIEIRQQSPIEISEDDARAEGFNSSGAFFDKLRSLYGPKTDLTAPYWALTLELVKP